jgi:hypothetical protein
MVCTVQEINFTNNGPLTRDDKYIILPQFWFNKINQLDS